MLLLKHLAVSSFNESVAYLHRDCDLYEINDIKNITKVEIHGGAAPILPYPHGNRKRQTRR